MSLNLFITSYTSMEKITMETIQTCSRHGIFRFCGEIVAFKTWTDISPFGPYLLFGSDFLDRQVQLLHDAQNRLDDLVVQQTAQGDHSAILAFKRSIQES